MPTWKRKEATRRNAIAPDEGDPRDGRGDDREEAHGASGRADARARRGRDGRRTAEPGKDPGAPEEHRPHPHDHARGRTRGRGRGPRSEEHTSELQSRTLISYAVFCLKKKKKNNQHQYPTTRHKKK